MNSLETVDQPQTCCSNCRTVFEVSRELLQSSDTRVRCGECLTIFDALLNVREGDNSLTGTDIAAEETVRLGSGANGQGQSSPNTVPEEYRKFSGLSDAGAAALAGLAKGASSKEVTYADFSLFNEDSDLPEVRYREQHDAASEVQDASVSENDLDIPEYHNADIVETVEYPSAVPLNKEVDFVTSDSQHSQIVFEYRDREPHAETAKGRRLTSDVDEMIERVRYGEYSPASEPSAESDHTRWSRFALPAGGALVCMALVWGFSAREALLINPAVSAGFNVVCSVLPCTAPTPVDISAFRQVKRAAFSHPTIDNALLIDFAFINDASFSQPPPVLAVLMEDQLGGVVVKNEFTPSEYLASWQQGDKLASGERLNVSLTVEDPGSDVTMFKVMFQ